MQVKQNALSTMDDVLPEGREVINGWGPDSSEIMLASDYPSREELLSGKALGAGYSRKVISGYLSDAGYDINKCYQTTYLRVPFSFPKNKKRQIEALAQVRQDFLPYSFDKILARE